MPAVECSGHQLVLGGGQFGTGGGQFVLTERPTQRGVAVDLEEGTQLVQFVRAEGSGFPAGHRASAVPVRRWLGAVMARW